MKKALFFIFAIFVCMGLHAQQVTLAAAITSAAKSVEEALPQKTKVGVVNIVSSSKKFSDYVVEELNNALVNGKKVTVADRRSLALIGRDSNLQISGGLTKESVQAIGQTMGAQFIITGTLTNTGSSYNLRIQVLNTANAAIQTQVSMELQNDSQVSSLLGVSSTTAKAAAPAPTQPAATNTPAPKNTPAAPAAPVTQTAPTAQVTTLPAPVNTPAASVSAEPAIEGIIVPGAGLSAKLTWLQRNVESHNTYIIEISANETIAPTSLNYKGALNITVVLKGDSVNRTVKLNTNGNMFTVNTNTTFILDNNITLQGHPDNNGSMVYVDGGKFRMRSGATITGNTRNHGHGGGVNLSSGNFEMSGGTIKGNTAQYNGGGVQVSDTFLMTGGTISGNTAGENGGGIEGGTVTMSGGTISGNTAKRGGGVSAGKTFTMRGGIITGNTAREYGGGLFCPQSWYFDSFSKTGGIITGYNTDKTNGNIVKDDEGTISRRGHTVYINENRRKETTSGPEVNLAHNNANNWDN